MTEQACPQCGVVIDLHAADGSRKQLRPNSVFYCLSCCTVNKIGADGTPVKPSVEELDRLLQLPMVKRAIQAAASAFWRRPS